MSLIQAIAWPDRAVIVADTASTADGQDDRTRTGAHGAGHVAKLQLVPHMPAAIAYRGTALLGGSIAITVSLLPSFDALDRAFADLAAKTVSQLPVLNPSLGEVVALKHEFVLAGWSERERRMVSRVWVKDEGAEAFRREDGPDDCAHFYPAPYEDASVHFETPVLMVDYIDLARRQAARLRGAGHAGGGDLVIATIRQDRIIADIHRDFCERRAAEMPGAVSAPIAIAGARV